MKESGLVACRTLLWDLIMMRCLTLSLIDLLVPFLIIVKDVEMTCWSIMLYIFVYLFVLASALCSFLSLCYRNFLFRHLVVLLCSILGLSDTWGVTVGISA